MDLFVEPIFRLFNELFYCIYAIFWFSVPIEITSYALHTKLQKHIIIVFIRIKICILYTYTLLE